MGENLSLDPASSQISHHLYPSAPRFHLFCNNNIRNISPSSNILHQVTAHKDTIDNVCTFLLPIHPFTTSENVDTKLRNLLKTDAANPPSRILATQSCWPTKFANIRVEN
jgi:hypothetical protein